MDCKDVRSLAEPYLSEQLPADSACQIVLHMERCPACRADFGERQRLREALRGAFERAPDLQPRPVFLRDLDARLRAGAQSLERRPPRRRWLAAAAGALAATALVAAGVTWLAESSLSELRHLALGGHRNCALGLGRPERVITLADAAVALDPAFRGLEAVRLPARSSAGDGIEVLERHACVYQGQWFAHIVVRYKDTAVSLLVADGAGSRFEWWEDAVPRVTSPASGVNVASFRATRHAVFVVSALPEADVRDLARELLAPVAGALQS